MSGIPTATWNMKGNRGEAVKPGLEAIIEDHAPITLGLMECFGNREAIGDVRRDLYRPAITAKGFEGSSTMLFVHKKAAIVRSGTMAVLAPWRGPQGGLHIGRFFPWAMVDYDGFRWVETTVHMPWGPTVNRRAWNASMARLIRFDRRFKSLPRKMDADWNMTFAKTGTGTVNALAHRLDLARARTGDPICYSLYADMAFRARAWGEFGSDHPIVKGRILA